MELTRYGQLENFFCIDHSDELSEQINTLILKQLFSALKYLHNTMNIMHRDIKPENILVSDYDFSKQRVYIMLTDFGFACQSQESSINAGTPHFKAPEIILGQEYDNKVDIWSAGCIAYYLYAGCYYPFGAEAETIDEIEDAIQNEEPDYEYL